MAGSIQIGNKQLGIGHPSYIVAEIGINHNGDLAIARKLIDAAVAAGCDAVKFQKRTPELSVPREQRDILRETPWGTMTYMQYRERVEFGDAEYSEISEYCQRAGIDWFTSCWDEGSVDFIERFNPICYKFASASLTDDSLLKHVAQTGRPIILSTGMSTMEQIRHAMEVINGHTVILVHSTSAYPCPTHELNLRMINTLAKEFSVPIGYSGHETGLQTTVAAVAIGAAYVERHITLDRAMWGSDQAASIEPHGFIRLVRDIRIVESAMGDGVKRVYESEEPIIRRLRRT